MELQKKLLIPEWIWGLILPLLPPLTFSTELRIILLNPGKVFIKEILRRWKIRDTETTSPFSVRGFCSPIYSSPLPDSGKVTVFFIARKTESYLCDLSGLLYPLGQVRPRPGNLLSSQAGLMQEPSQLLSFHQALMSLPFTSCVSLHESLNLSVLQLLLKWGKHYLSRVFVKIR